MNENIEQRAIPVRLEGLFKWGWKTDELIEVTGRYIEGLMKWDYLYKTDNDKDLKNLKKLIKVYSRAKKNRSPDNVGLLNTKTYKVPSHSLGESDFNLWLDMRIPHIAKKIRAFWIGKAESKRTDREKEAYCEWLRNTLLIDRETAETDPDRAEQVSTKYIADAVNDINSTLIAPLERIIGNEGKSGYYGTIYREGVSAYELLRLTQKHFKAYRLLCKKSELTDKQKRSKDDHNKAMYEISRIFAFASMYIDIDHMPWKGTYKGDKVFLVSKLLELTNYTDIPTAVTIIDMPNPFYEFTDSVEYYWKKKTTGPGYEYFAKKNIQPIEDDDEDDVSQEDETIHVSKLESIDLSSGQNGIRKSIKVLHIDFRGEKKTQSTAHKILRKGLLSPREVLDTRGFRFVVATKEEANTLLSILIQELTSGPERAWAEKPHWQTNDASGENFECFKWTLNVIHKGHHTRSVLDHLQQNLTDSEADLLVKKRFEYLFTKNGHILETEVQIFIWTDSYIAAHCDKESKAYADNYKKEQHLEEASLVFPPTIFPEAHRQIIKKIAEKPFTKILTAIQERQPAVNGVKK